MPPMMPFIHDALWLGLFAGLALFAWRMAERFDFRLSALDVRRPFGRGGEAPLARFTAPPAHSSGNTAFDEWRDGELAKIEAQRGALEARLQRFAAFVDKLRRAEDRATFERFMAEHHDATHEMRDVGEVRPN